MLQQAATPSSNKKLEPLSRIGNNMLVPFMMHIGDQYNFLTETGMFNFSNAIKRIKIDVGAHDKVDVTEIGHDRSLFVIAFEPTPYNYLKNPSHERLLMLPHAVSTDEGFTNFYMSAYDECNSLLPQSADVAPYLNNESYAIKCITTQQKITVPTIRMETILKMIPSQLEVELLKIDAQGFDVQVAKSAGNQIRRVRRLILECQDVARNDPLLLYKGAGTKADAVEYMRSVGFVLDSCEVNNEVIKEINCVFKRTTV